MRMSYMQIGKLPYERTGDQKKDWELYREWAEAERVKKEEERMKKFFLVRWFGDLWEWLKPRDRLLR